MNAIVVPRRTVLGALLVDAAREAGAEVRERFTVEELVVEDGRVTGIRGHDHGGAVVTEQARIVIGADGKHSLVAKTVQPTISHERPVQTMPYYTYWADVPINGGQVYARDHRAIGAWPARDFHAFREDIEGNFLATLDLTGDLGKRIRAGKRADRFYGTVDLPNVFRKPYGPGWALVGDAGLVIDPITARGISDAFRDAELLANAIVAGLDGRQPLDAALAGYERARTADALPMYEFTGQLASFAPSIEGDVLFAALAGRPAEITRFFGVMSGAIPLAEYMTPQNLRRIIGIRGMARILAGKLRGARSQPPSRALTHA